MEKRRKYRSSLIKNEYYCLEDGETVVSNGVYLSISYAF
jgi:hypothetical protein